MRTWAIPLLVLVLGGVTGPAQIVTKKTPHFIECTADAVVIHPDGGRVSWEDLQKPQNALQALLTGVQKRRDQESIIVLVRPQSVRFYRQVRNLIGTRPIEVGYDGLEAGLEFKHDQQKAEWQVWQGAERELPGFKIAGPRALPANKQPVFFECRGNALFYVDKESLDEQVRAALSELKPGRAGDFKEFIKMLEGKELGNTTYKVDHKYLLAGVMALDPRPDAKGETLEQAAAAKSQFRATLQQFDKDQHYIVFLTRDDSFAMLRSVRELAQETGFDTTWEFLGADEPIKFGQGGPRQ